MSDNKDSKQPSMMPILIATFGIVLGLVFLIYSQFNKSTQVLGAHFQLYQFVTDLQFYLMDDESCSKLLKGNTITDSGSAKLNWPGGRTLEAGSSLGFVTIKTMGFSEVEGGREDFYSAKLTFDVEVPEEEYSPVEFQKNRSLRFYFKGRDGSLETCGVKDMLSNRGE